MEPGAESSGAHGPPSHSSPVTRVGLGLFQTVGDQAEQLHVNCYRDWSSLFVFVLRQPCGPIDERPGTVAVAVVECPTRFAQQIRGALLAGDAERLQDPAGNRLDVAQRSVRSPSAQHRRPQAPPTPGPAAERAHEVPPTAERAW
jgi:hypothetical protein